MRLHKDAKTELLKKVPLFSGCSKPELQRIASLADELDLAEGATLIREGERGREFIVVADGTVRVTRNGRKVRDLGAGDFIGEIALVADVPRTATVTATSPVRLLVVTDRARCLQGAAGGGVALGDRPALRAAAVRLHHPARRGPAGEPVRPAPRHFSRVLSLMRSATRSAIASPMSFADAFTPPAWMPEGNPQFPLGTYSIALFVLRIRYFKHLGRASSKVRPLRVPASVRSKPTFPTEAPLSPPLVNVNRRGFALPSAGTIH